MRLGGTKGYIGAMPIYTKESLETLRQRVDLVAVVESHIELKRAGSSYKALCPFHDEKTPSFVVQPGDKYYHCFGCGAHGDAIQFLMSHLKMSFHDAVETLAQKFGVHLELAEGERVQGPNKRLLREAVEEAALFYQAMLLHTDEGHAALEYLYHRGLDLNFIRHFRLGLALKESGVLRRYLREQGVSNDVMQEAGLLKEDGRDFFYDRILFPIHAPSGHIIGFSGRKYKESTGGGKYVNSPETALFKKSRVLYGFHLCRRRIAKEQRAIVVEGQVDALRLIQAGFNITVAGQGTAFGMGQVSELLNLGIKSVFLALDSDAAGNEAAVKIGNLFQKEGVEVEVVTLPLGSDPDAFLSEEGPDAFAALLTQSVDYLTFLVDYHSKSYDMASPAGKNQLVTLISQQIRQWNHPLVVHESLRKLATLTHVPENVIGVDQTAVPNIYVKREASVGIQTVDPDRIVECDLLRWLLLLGGSKPEMVTLVRSNLAADAFKVNVCRHIYETYMENSSASGSCDLLQLVSHLDDAEGQLVLGKLLEKKVNMERADEHLIETIQSILNRNWMEEREAIKVKIHSGRCSDEEVMQLVHAFDALKRTPPEVQLECVS